MNRSLLNLGMASACLAALLGSCSDELDAPGARFNTVITATMDHGAAESRTAIDPASYLGGELGILWVPTDTIGVFSDSQRNAPFTNGLEAPKGRTQFRGNLSGTPTVAYFPWSALNDGADPSQLRGTLPTVQHWNLATREVTADYKYGTPRPYYPDEFEFRHVFSMLKVTVDVTGTEVSSERLQSLKIIAPEAQLSGDFTFSAIDGSWRFTDAGADNVTLSFDDRPQMNDGSSFTGYLSCAPTLKAGQKIEIQVTTDSHRATFPATMLVDFAAGNVYNFTVVLKNHADKMEITEVTVPTLNSFEFEVKCNPGKILGTKVVPVDGGKSVTEEAVTTQSLAIEDHKISGMIPYLWDFTLVPTFTASAGSTVYANGVEQTSGKSEVDFSSPVKYTVVGADGTEAEYTVEVTNTGLPVMVIEQSSATLAPDHSWFGRLSLRSKDTEWVADDQIALYDRTGRYTMDPQAGGVRLRGNTSQEFPKLPLAIKLAKKAAVGDMPKHKRWVLLANWLDNSLVRNDVAFAIAHATEAAWRNGGLEPGLTWNPHGTGVELVVDGRHVGHYYLCEQIKIDSKRLDIKDAYEDLVKDGLPSTYADCGFLIECDDNYDEAYKFKTSPRDIPFMLKDDANTVPDEYFSQIKTKIQGIEDNLKNGKYTAAYADLDIYSVIDQWIVYELTMNDEYRHPKSVYMYMDGGDSKLCAGPVWDFDWQTFPNSTNISSLNKTYGPKSTPRSMSAWMYSNSKLGTSWFNSEDAPYMWYPYLFKDANFRQAVQTRWEAIYPHLLAVSAEIAGYVAENEASWQVNHAMWPVTFKRPANRPWCFNGDENFATYAEVIRNLMAMYNQRLDWMNSAITSGNFVTNAK